MIAVDGAPTRAELLNRGTCFASRLDVDSVSVVIVGRGVPFVGLRLSRVDDLSPAIDAWRRLTAHLRT